MKKTEKRTETKTTRRPYSKPQIEKVQLVPEEAVLQGCKGNDIQGQGGPNLQPPCPPDGIPQCHLLTT